MKLRDGDEGGEEGEEGEEKGGEEGEEEGEGELGARGGLGRLGLVGSKAMGGGTGTESRLWGSWYLPFGPISANSDFRTTFSS